jgi:hypothetical protein
MRKYCSDQLATECQTWHHTVLTLLAGTALATVFMHIEGFDHWVLYKNIMLALAAFVIVGWCLWTVRTIRSILYWWQDMHRHLDSAEQLLKETKDEIKVIKDLSKPDPK